MKTRLYGCVGSRSRSISIVVVVSSVTQPSTLPVLPSRTCTPDEGRAIGAYGGGAAGGVVGGVSGGGGVDGKGGGEGSGAHCSQRQRAVHFSAQGGGMDGGGGGGEGGGGGGSEGGKGGKLGGSK